MLACSIEICPDRPVPCPEVEALLVLVHRRSGGAGAGSAMRRRPVVNEHQRIPAIALSPAMACISRVAELGEPSAGWSHFRTARAFISREFEKSLIKFSIMRLCVYVAVSPLVNFGRWWARFNWRPTGTGWGQ